MIDATPWANTISGQIVLPVIAGLLVVLIVGAIRIVPRMMREQAANRRLMNERFDRLEDRTDAQDVKLESIEHETHTNSGSSIKDAVIRIEGKLDVFAVRQKATDQKVDDHMAQARLDLQRIDRALERRPHP